MNNLYRLVCPCLAVVLMFSSCSLERRHYMNGYHVQWDQSNNASKNLHEKQLEEEAGALSESVLIENGELTASSALEKLYIPEHTVVSLTKRHDGNAKNAEDCDIVVLRDGTEIKAKVIEINPSQIKYKKCSELNGPELTINKSKVSMVKYSNGTNEVFQLETTITSDNSSKIEKKVKKLSKLTLLFGILSFIPLYGVGFGVAAIIIGSLTLHKCKENGIDDPKAKKRAKIGLLLGIGGILIAFGTLAWIIFDTFL